MTEHKNSVTGSCYWNVWNGFNLSAVSVFHIRFFFSRFTPLIFSHTHFVLFLFDTNSHSFQHETEEFAQDVWTKKKQSRYSTRVDAAMHTETTIISYALVIPFRFRLPSNITWPNPYLRQNARAKCRCFSYIISLSLSLRCSFFDELIRIDVLVDMHFSQPIYLHWCIYVHCTFVFLLLSIHTSSSSTNSNTQYINNGQPTKKKQTGAHTYYTRRVCVSIHTARTYSRPANALLYRTIATVCSKFTQI